MKIIARILFAIALLSTSAAAAAPYYQSSPTTTTLQAIPNPALVGRVAVQSYASGTSLGGGEFDYTATTITPDGCVNFAASGGGTWVRRLPDPSAIDLTMCGVLDPIFTDGNDNSAVIANALAYAKAYGGLTRIHVPAGVYLDNGCFDTRDTQPLFQGDGRRKSVFASNLGTACSLNAMFEMGLNASTTAIAGVGFEDMQVNPNGKLNYGVIFSGAQNAHFDRSHCANALVQCISGHSAFSTNLAWGWFADSTFFNPSFDESFGTEHVGDIYTLPAWNTANPPPTSTASCMGFSDNTAANAGVPNSVYGNSDTRNSLIEPSCYVIFGNGFNFGYSTTDHIWGGQYNLNAQPAGAPEPGEGNAVEFQDTLQTSHCGGTVGNKSAEHIFVIGLENGKGYYYSDNRYAAPNDYTHPCGVPAYSNMIWLSTDNGGVDNVKTMPGAAIEVFEDQNYATGIGFGCLIASAGQSMQTGTAQANAYQLSQQYAGGNCPGGAFIGSPTQPGLALDDTNLNQSNVTSVPDTGNIAITTGINSAVGWALDVASPGTSCYVQASTPCNTISGDARNIGRLMVPLASGDTTTYAVYKKQSVTVEGVNNTDNVCDGNISGPVTIVGNNVVLANSFYPEGCGSFTAAESTSSATLNLVGALPANIAQVTTAVVSDLTNSTCIAPGTTIMSYTSGTPNTITLSVAPSCNVGGGGDLLGISYNTYVTGGLLLSGNAIAIPVTSTSSGAGNRVKYLVANSDAFAANEKMAANGVAGSSAANGENLNVYSVDAAPGGTHATSGVPWDANGSGGWMGGIPAALPQPSVVVQGNLAAQSQGVAVTPIAATATNDSGLVELTLGAPETGLVAGVSFVWVSGINPNAGTATPTGANGTWGIESVIDSTHIVLASVWNAGLMHTPGTVSWSQPLAFSNLAGTIAVPSQIDATGTPSSTTYLSGAGTWAQLGTAAPLNTGNSVVNPGSGNLEIAQTVQSVTAGNAKVWATTDCNKYQMRSNSGSAMTDTLPTGNGTCSEITVENEDASATDTFSVAGGGTIGGNSTYVLTYGRRATFAVDGAGNYRPWVSNNSEMRGPSSSVATDVADFCDTTGKTACDSGIPFSGIAQLGDAQTWTALQKFTNSDLAIMGSSTGYTTFTSANAGASNYAATLPANTGTIGELNLADQTLSGGVNETSYANTTGNVTVDCGKNPQQYIVNGGAFTITAPANDGNCILLVRNNASAGAIAFSGFTVGANTGAALTTTNGNLFTIMVWRVTDATGSVAGYNIFAHQ